MPEHHDPNDPKRRKAAARTDDPRDGDRARDAMPDFNSGSASADADSLPSGTGLGKYRILERISSGPTATIYKARDHLLDRPVVIKHLSPQLADDPSACGRFRREAYILAQIGQEARYVIAIHELIEHQRGLFIVTEYVPGWTLETLIAKRQLSLQAILELMARILLGLRSIHAAGFIHRDLAPRHIIADVRCRPKITDFSLATNLGSEPDYTIATPPYTAPEIYLREAYDDSVDIYSAGVIAYEMLVGRVAFKKLVEERVGPGNDPIRWLAWHASNDATWPEAHELNSQVPPILSAIVARMMSASVEDRFACVDDVLTLLVRHFSRTPRPAISSSPVVDDSRSLPGIQPSYSAPTPPALPYVPAQPAAVNPAYAPQAPPPRSDWMPPASAPREAPRQTQTISIPLSNVEVAASSAVAPSPWQHVESRKTVVPPTWVVRSESAPSSSTSRPRTRRLRRRLGATLAVLIAISGVAYGAWKLVPLVYLSPVESVERLINEARSAYSADEFRRAVDLLRQAAGKDLHGAKGFELRDEAARWLALSEARESMRDGHLERAEDRLRDAVELGINPDLVADLHRELIRAQSGARLKKQFGNGNGNAEPGATAPPAEAAPVPTPPEPSKPRPIKFKTEKNSITAENTEKTYRRLVEHARDELQRENYDEAFEALRQASALKQTLEVDELAGRVLLARERRQELNAAEASMASGDYDLAAKHYREAQRRDANPEVEKKLRRALALSLVNEGRDLLEAGKAREAENKFRAAAWRDPSAGAEQELERARPTITAVSDVEKADRALGEGDLAKALELYEGAMPNLPESLKSAVETKIARLRADAATRGSR